MVEFPFVGGGYTHDKHERGTEDGEEESGKDCCIA
jgi:hypothetical protein